MIMNREGPRIDNAFVVAATAVVVNISFSTSSILG